MMINKLFAALLTVMLSLGMIPGQPIPLEPALAAVSPEVTNASTPAPEAAKTPSTTSTEAVLLTAEEAEALALAHAELHRDQVRFSRTEFDQDPDIPHWEVEFRHGDWEYDYEIHARTGVILEQNKEYDPAPPAPTTPPATEPPATKPQTVTADEAKSIALAHAGLKAGQVNRVRIEKDRDDGIWVYEVEFSHGNWEYDYEIHAETGKILEWDKDYDD